MIHRLTQVGGAGVLNVLKLLNTPMQPCPSRVPKKSGIFVYFCLETRDLMYTQDHPHVVLEGWYSSILCPVHKYFITAEPKGSAIRQALSLESYGHLFIYLQKPTKSAIESLPHASGKHGVYLSPKHMKVY